MTMSQLKAKHPSTPNNLDCGLWWVFVLPTESIDLHVGGDLALCEQTICSPTKQASYKQYTLGECKISNKQLYL